MVDVNDELAAELAEEAAAVSPDEPEKPTLERMEQLAAELNDIDERIAKNQARIDELKQRRDVIVAGELVELMDDAHVSSLQVGPRTFKAQSYYKAVIPADDPEPGLNWLEENDAGDLIKNCVMAEFPRGAEEEAMEAFEMIRQRYQMATVSRKRTVHHMTLTAWLKELYQSTNPHKIMPPLDLIGGVVGRIVKITNAKG